MYSSDTNRAQRVIRLLRIAEVHQLDRAELLFTAGISEEQIADPDSRVPVEGTIRLWRRVADLVDDPDIGLEVGSHLRLRNSGVVGYAMLHSETLLGSLRRLVRYAKLINQRAEVILEDLGDRWRFVALHQPLIPGFRQPVDEGIAGLMTGFQQIVGRDLVAAELHFNYPRPASTAAHRKLLGPNLTFDQPRPAIVLWSRDVDSATVAPDPTLSSYLDELAEVHLEALPRIDSYAAKVSHAIWPHLSEGSLSIEEVAAKLAISTRSLQRRLREEGTSFAQVVDDLRREKSLLLLRDANLAVYEIGYLLGYSDPSTFHRAFRRWQGTSPSQYRAELFS